MIQGKQALVGKENGLYKVEEIPVIESSQNIQTDSVFISITEKSITGVGMLNITGYEKNTRTHYLAGKNNQQTKDFLRAFLIKGNNKFSLDYFL
ncbi:MAG: hypothetical protein HC905_19930 [Bacteroidales bacterium]|nr:hypothetical protein [Bacteroidales bacterium]